MISLRSEYSSQHPLPKHPESVCVSEAKFRIRTESQVTIGAILVKPDAEIDHEYIYTHV